jgi:HEAT repeat protein
MKHDRRTVHGLFNAALCEPDEEAWKSIAALHWRATGEVLERATALCRSECPIERHVGADVLGQLGVPDRAFPRECAAVLLRMLDHENEADVLQSIYIALSHLDEPRTISVAAKHMSHSDPNVRRSVVMALMGHQDQTTIDLLIKLTTDADPHVRDWATFALGTYVDLDTSDIRNALAVRLEDADDDARAEAIIGLARRKDQRVVPAIQRELAADIVGLLAIEAAELIASPDLLLHLIELRECWQDDAPSGLHDAIAACTPS